MFDDRNNDGLFNGADAGLAGVTVALVDGDGTPVVTTTTDDDGRYTFSGTFAAGTYRLVADQPGGYLDGKETAGNLGGTVDLTQDSNTISGISLAAGAAGTDYDFGFLRPSRLQALVWEDANDDGEVNFGERAIADVLITLTGVDDRGAPVQQSMWTDAQGLVEFVNLRPGVYTITETQPAGVPDGQDRLGSLGGDNSVNDRFANIVLQPGSDGVNYNFGELRPAGGNVQAGQTASIGFWQNKHGQNLIKSVNGGPTSTQLANWLATTFPNLYGSGAGENNLTGKTNAQVADLYTSLFKRNGQTTPGGPPKLDAQVLATALAVYVTNQNLAGTTAAAYGFEVTATGVGTATFDIGSHGAAFGVANHSVMTVLDILLATNALCVNGLLYDVDGTGTISSAEQGLRTQANEVYSTLNELGSI